MVFMLLMCKKQHAKGMVEAYLFTIIKVNAFIRINKVLTEDVVI